MAISVMPKTLIPLRDRGGNRRKRGVGLFDRLTVVVDDAPVPVRPIGRRDSKKPAYLASGGLRAEESIAPDPARDSARWDGKTPGNAMGPLAVPSGHLPTLAVLLRMLPSRPGRRQERRRVHHLMMSINFSTAAGGPEMMRLLVG
jgi:hypothetical protein